MATGSKPASEPISSGHRSILAIAGVVALGLGALGVVGAVTGLVFGSALPEVIRLANFGAAILEGSLAVGILRRRRAAWAFLVAMEWTMVVVNALALPQMLAAGSAGHVAIGFAAGRAVLAVLLTLGKDEV